jgi:hypothetical protein
MTQAGARITSHCSAFFVTLYPTSFADKEPRTSKLNVPIKDEINMEGIWVHPYEAPAAAQRGMWVFLSLSLSLSLTLSAFDLNANDST